MVMIPPGLFRSLMVFSSVTLKDMELLELSSSVTSIFGE
jgi:hypothetical protein